MSDDVLSRAIGKTVMSVAGFRTNEGCYEVRLGFTDGSELTVEGGFYDGTIRVDFAPIPPAAPQVRACTDG